MDKDPRAEDPRAEDPAGIESLTDDQLGDVVGGTAGTFEPGGRGGSGGLLFGSGGDGGSGGWV